MSIGQVEQQLSNNNINAGGSFVEVGLQQMNVRALGLFRTVHDIEQTMLTTKSGTPLRVRDIAEVTQGPKIRLGHMARANHMEDERIIDEPDVIQGIVLMRKGAEEESTLAAIHKKVDQLNNGILPPGVTVVPMLDRSDLLHFTLNTVLHNLTEGMILVTVILFLFLLNVRSAFIVALTIPFSLLFASIWLNPRALSPQTSYRWAPSILEWWWMGPWSWWKTSPATSAIGVAEPDSPQKTAAEMIREACHEVQRPVFYAIAIIITAYLPIIHAATRGRPDYSGHDGLDGDLRSSRRDDVFDSRRACAGSRTLSEGSPGAAQPSHGISDGTLSAPASLGRPSSLVGRFRLALPYWLRRSIWLLRRRHRSGVPAAPGRRWYLGAGHSSVQHQSLGGR